MDLAIDFLTANPDSKVKIALPGNSEADDSSSVEGFTRRGFQLNLTSQYQAPGANVAQSSLTKLVNGTTEFLNMWFGTTLPQIRIEHPLQTINFWTGSTRPVFSVPLMFVAVHRGDDVREPVRKLARGVTPTLGVAFFYVAPLGYAPDIRAQEGQARGTIALEIGRWFRAGGLIMKTSDFTFGGNTPDGFPAWAEGTVEFTPFRAVTVEDVDGWFRSVV